MEKLFYHGTVVAYLSSIEKEGLRPIKANRFQGRQFFSNRSMKIEDGVYLTTNKQTAAAFAVARAVYLVTPPGEVVVTALAFIKDKKAPVEPKSQPIVLTVKLPENIVSQLKGDHRSDDNLDALWCPCTIPPQYIVNKEFPYAPL